MNTPLSSLDDLVQVVGDYSLLGVLACRCSRWQCACTDMR